MQMLHGFALEVFLNTLIIKNKVKIKIISWPKVISPMKRKLFGIHFDFFVIGITVMREISFLEIISQVIQLRKLMV
jgi:hypothetical protein